MTARRQLYPLRAPAHPPVTGAPLPDRERLALLAEVGQLLASDDDHLDVLTRVAELIVPALCDHCAIYLRGKTGVLDRVAIVHVDSAICAASQLAVPMTVGGRVLGVLQLCRTDGPAFDLEDLVFAGELARRIGLYVDRAWLARDQAAVAAELERSNRDLDRFVDVASHDLKAPLRGIANLARMIEDDLGGCGGAAVRERFALLRDRVHWLESMIDGVVSYRRAGHVAERPQQVDLGKVVREVIALLDPPREARFEVDPGLPMLVTVRLSLEQVFLNLIGNAIKHAGKRDLHVAIGGRRGVDGWELFVRDDGPGIAPHHHDQIWGMFRTLTPRDDGDAGDSTGIGLAIVRRIVESSGGRVWIESEVGAGATFWFSWPTAPRRPRHTLTVAP